MCYFGLLNVSPTGSHQAGILPCVHMCIDEATRVLRSDAPIRSLPDTLLRVAMPQLTVAEQSLTDKITRTQKRSGADAWRAINAQRTKKGVSPVSVVAVHQYVNGKTHQKGRADRRGQGQNALTRAHIRRLVAVRRRLTQKADGEHRVTYADVISEASLDVECCQRVIEDALRAEGIGYRAARSKVQITEGDAKKRLEFAEEWCKKPPSFWTNAVHGFLDCKAWPVPLTPAQRRRYRQTRVTGHLRFPGEGTDHGFTRPRQKHDWLGIPAITIAAVVSVDRVIMFEHVKGRWNGEAARSMYTDLVAPALKKRFPGRRTRVRACVCDRVIVVVACVGVAHRASSRFESCRAIVCSGAAVRGRIGRSAFARARQSACVCMPGNSP